jgi:hypothetical protein
MDQIASIRRRRSGMVMVVAMIFIVIFSALALSLAITSGTNAEIAVNQIRADQAKPVPSPGFRSFDIGSAGWSSPGESQPTNDSNNWPVPFRPS